MNKKITDALCENKIIAIVRGVQEEKLLPLTQALYNGGIRFIEITYSADGKITDEKTAEYIKLLCDNFKEKMYIGAGTVLSTKQVELTKNAGGQFIISPDASEEVIKRTCELNMVSIPGALTPTEVQTAHKAGADFVKLFPVTNLGVDYVKAIKAPLSHIKFLAVGGINTKNMCDYLKAGVCGFGIGGNIINKDMLEKNNYEALENLAKDYVSALN